MRGALSFCRIPPGATSSRLKYPSSIYRSEAKYDKLVAVITLGAWLGLSTLNAWLLYLALGGIIPAEVAPLVVALAALLSLAVLLVLPLFSPRAFELTAEGIAVKRVVRSFVVPYDQVAKVERMRWTWRGFRICASWGLYGFFGLFYVKRLGRVWMYVTNRDNVILIETRGGVRYALSPDDPESFLSRLEAILRGRGS